jgi:thioredoxin-related protein
VTGTAARAQSELGYDPAADPFAQVQAAKVTATAEQKHILLVAGGDWCIWCHYLNAFLHGHDKIGAALERTFVVVKVYYGDETDNDEFFMTLPEAAGYPHFWILDADGDLLESQGTLPLEDGDKSYDPGRFMAFIDKWERSVPP